MFNKNKIDYILHVINTTENLDQLKNIENWINNMYNKMKKYDYLYLLVNLRGRQYYMNLIKMKSE